MFPTDRYTPHGYLDNPAHGFRSGREPGGVLRSRPAIGVGWHAPSLAHAYNRKEFYRAFLQLGFILPDGTLLLEAADFEKAGIELYSPYHSKNLLDFAFSTPTGINVQVGYFVPDQEGGNVLGCVVAVTNAGVTAQTVQMVACADYRVNWDEGLKWTSGLYSRITTAADFERYRVEYVPNCQTVGAFQEGAHFHLAVLPPDADRATNFPPVRSLDVLRNRLTGTKLDEENEPTRLVAVSGLSLQVQPGATEGFGVVLGRGETELQAVKATHAYTGAGFRERLQELRQADTDFYQNAPRLSGDWPDFIRRGLVYDFETLRMMVRRPTGIYQHPWEAMQLQNPRVVLAEAALDMLILSYADPQAAQAVLFGTFADAPEPNVPCSREDGSYNMVAADGSPCGTAPEWCFPFHCINLVYHKTGDKEWLGRLYPLLEDFIGFWLTERTNEQGRPFYKCSWEAGQDNSARFGIKDDVSGGGALTEHLWPVDLQAALAQSCRLLSEWAAELGREGEHWAKLAERYTSLTRHLWHNDWFHDFDMRQDAFTEVLDTMQLAPVLCGTATSDHIAALLPKLADPPKHGQIFHPLMWPSVAFCLIEACSEAGQYGLAARHSWNAVKPVYQWLDSRPASVEPDAGGVPGVSREYWPQVVRAGGGGGGAEVYGWGCLTALMLLRYVVGFREEKGETPAFVLRPDLPVELLQNGRRYGVGPLSCRGARLDLTYTVGPALQVDIDLTLPRPLSLEVHDEKGQVVHQAAPAARHSVRLNLPNSTSVSFFTR